MIRWVAGAALFLCLLGFQQVRPDTLPRNNACTVVILNFTKITFTVAFVHGDVAKQFTRPVTPGASFSTIVPCDKADVPIQFLLTNTSVPGDFKVRDVQVPPPGDIQIWCLGDVCPELMQKIKGISKGRIT